MEELKRKIAANRAEAMERKRRREALREVCDNPTHNFADPQPARPPVEPRRAHLGLLYGDEEAEALDAALGACLAPGAVSEISGPASAGKTALAATVAAFALRRSRRACVLFVETNGPHPHRRCVDVASGFLAANDVRQRVMSTTAMDAERAIAVLKRDVARIAAERQVALVVLDSLGDLMREGSDAQSRKHITLRVLAAVADVSAPILFTNHVAASFSRTNDASGGAPAPCADARVAKVATLRFALSRVHTPSNRRRLCLVGAPSRDSTTLVDITKAGVVSPQGGGARPAGSPDRSSSADQGRASSSSSPQSNSSSSSSSPSSTASSS